MTMLVSHDPATGEVVGEVEITTPAHVVAAVERARAAQAGWAALGLEGRRAVLGRAAGLIEAAVAEVADLMQREMGKPRAEAEGEVRSCGGRAMLAELDEMVEALAPEVFVSRRTRSTILRDPLGVVAAITPWNFPFSMPHWLVLPALMAGNAVVLKPSELTPLVGQRYADLLNVVLPDGVLQVVHGADEQGRALVDADVQLVAFTGSVATGKSILSASVPGLKRVLLELGGKDPLLVLDDADVPAAARFAAHNGFRNAGQVCISTERIYVHERVAEAFVEVLAREARGMTVGPMVSADQRDHVLRQVQDALGAGATSVVGLGSDGEGKGNHLPPTVLINVTPEMRIASEETFGPVVCVTAVADDDEAVDLANSTEFGLGAVVFGGDLERAERVARRLDSGMVGVNRGPGGAAGTPWVGARHSGYGYHKSRDGHRQFAQTRVLSVPTDTAG